MTTELKGWIALHPQSALTDSIAITPDNRGMAYGDGFFTTMAVVDGEIVWANYHERRLDTHAQALQLALPKSSLLSALKSHAQQLQQGMMKVVITRAPQNLRGYSFSADEAGNACEIWLKSTGMSVSSSMKASFANGQTVSVQAATQAICLTSQLACLPPTLAGLKSLNRLDNVLASGELESIRAHSVDARRLGEGLLRDMSGSWVEGTMSNVFYQLLSSDHQERTINNLETNYLTTGQWFTPPITQSGVNGVMRQVIIDAFSQTDQPVITRALEDKDLPQLSKLFFCNAVRGVIPVDSLNLLGGGVIELSL